MSLHSIGKLAVTFYSTLHEDRVKKDSKLQFLFFIFTLFYFVLSTVIIKTIYQFWCSVI